MLLGRLVRTLFDLRVAIALLLLIAVASALGTAIPQGKIISKYHDIYDSHPWLGLVNGDWLLRLQLDHVYSSGWFLLLLTWLGLALILCSWRRQWPALRAALRWIDYRTGRQLSKLSLAETVIIPDTSGGLEYLAQRLRQRGWQVREQPGRLAARSGVLGRVGPLFVHTGLVLLMIGAAWGALAGNRLERFLAPGKSLNLLNRDGDSQIIITLVNFNIDRDPAGRPEQFRSALSLQSTGQAVSLEREVSVNHPLRHLGMTVYQADWSLVALTLQLGNSPALQLPLSSYPQLGEQVWGLVLPTKPNGSSPVLLTVGSDQGPVTVFGSDGQRLALIRPGGPAVEINGIPLRVLNVLPASGLLLKRDPGVPLVYTGFAVTLLGGGLSLIATRQLWAVSEANTHSLHVGGLCNRNLPAFAREIPVLLAGLERCQQG